MVNVKLKMRRFNWQVRGKHIYLKWTVKTVNRIFIFNWQVALTLKMIGMVNCNKAILNHDESIWYKIKMRQLFIQLQNRSYISVNIVGKVRIANYV